MTTPILGRGPENRNPLLVLAESMDAILTPLRQIAENTKPDATAVMPHRYCIAEANDKGGHGKVWGVFCLACSDSHGQYIYPCQLPEEMLGVETANPPMFFTIGDVFDLDEHGRMRRVNSPSSS